jgi:peroxiredoxin
MTNQMGYTCNAFWPNRWPLDEVGQGEITLILEESHHLRRIPMSLLVRSLLLIALLFPAPLLAEETRRPTPTIGAQIEEFGLSDPRGKTWTLADFDDNPIVVVVFMGTECPLMKLYAPRLANMATEFADHGVAFVGINSNQQDGLSEIANYARVHKIAFPILKDPGNRVADQFGATRTPQVFVLDAQRRVRYHGSIDDQYHYGIQRQKADHDYLRDAVTSLAAGRDITIQQTEAIGCQIGRILSPRSGSKVTYSKQISRILQKSCIECHRSGEVAPFALTDYDEVVGWAGMIAEVVEQRRMPPWHADERYGHFINDSRLTSTERHQIASWVEAGAPEGDVADLPAPRKFVEGWRIGKPDQVIYMSDKPFVVPADGVVPYKHFIVDPGFTEDKWIQAAECRIGNRAVVHHIVVAPVSRDRLRSRAHGELHSVWLAATAPGARPMILPQGLAKRVPAGSKLVFQMHYTPNGTQQEDRSSIGLVFADPKTVQREVVTQRATNRRFRIPAGADNHQVKASFTFRQDSVIFAMFPHMHLRGKSFRYTARYPNGKTEVLLNVPHYDFNWQNGYEFTEAKLMPRDTILECVAHFDNSEDNPANPDPRKTVTWGDQTWEEMMIGYFDMAVAQPPEKSTTSSNSRTKK